jgi:hypothetical protein
MTDRQTRRPRRNPLSAEEVANIIAYKKRRELERIGALKATASFKFQNIFNLFCTCIYLELLFCFFGPSNYTVHYAYQVLPQYGEQINHERKPIVADLDMICVQNEKFNFVVDDFISIPSRFTTFTIGKDFILQKDLKGTLDDSDRTYRLFSASPVLFLAIFILIIIFGAYIYDLNENAYSLMALSVLNSMSILGILFL